MQEKLIIRQLGLQPYEPVWRAMQNFTDQRTCDSLDEIWLLEHEPVFTLGMNGKKEHILQASLIPLVQIDRGGQVTYHGPGQLIAYLLIDLARKKLGVRDLVDVIEQSLIALLADLGIEAQLRPKAPGVYVQEKKIAALGLRVRKGRSYHGLSLNVQMDLTPFQTINPCGYAGLGVTQIADWLSPPPTKTLQQLLIDKLSTGLGYNEISLSIGAIP